MARTGRPGLSHEQKAELWRRWEAGETLSDIGQACGFGVWGRRSEEWFCAFAPVTAVQVS